MTKWIICLYAVALSTLTAQPNPGSLFTHRAEVFVDASGLTRLTLPTEMLSDVAPDLSDVRLYDSQGREVPYLIDPGAPRYGDFATAGSAQPKVLSVDRSTTKPERGKTRYREVYAVEISPGVQFTGRWRLRLQHRGGEFVRRIDVVQLSPSGRRIPLLEGGSYFRLQRGRVARDTFDLPNLSSRQVEIAIEGEGSDFISPTVWFDSEPQRRELAPREIPLTVLETAESGQFTELTFDRPRGLPILGLRFSTSTPAFARYVTVLDQMDSIRLVQLGDRPTIFRAPVEPSLENLKIEFQFAPQGNRLKARINNADSPPLDDLSVTGLIAVPSLLFTLSPGQSGVAAGILRFGGGRASRPRYDLEGLAAMVWPNQEPLATLRSATLGPIEPSPEYVVEPRLGFASRPGATVNAAAYTHTQSVHLEPSPEGLTRIELTVQDAAVCRPDFADVRLTDADGAQWAYLLDRDTRRDWLALEVDSAVTADSATTYRLVLPASGALIDRLRLDFPNEYFNRTYQLAAKVDGADRLLAADRLEATMGDVAPIEIAFDAVRPTELMLIIANGNDQPLSSPKAEGRFPLADLYTVAPAGDYKLLLGFPDDRPPVYELEQASATVLAARAGAAVLGEIADNPHFSASSRIRTGPGAQKALFWVALLAAVGVLGVMTLKTVRGEAGDAS